MFLKASTMNSAIFFWNERGAKGVLCKNTLLADLLGSQHLLEVLQTSLTFENRENVVKSGCFGKRLGWTAPFLFRNKGGI